MITTLHRGLLTAVLILLAFTVVPVPSFASHSWEGYHWARTSNPFILQLGDNVSSTWDDYLATASVEWNLSEVLETTIVAGRTRPRTCKPTNGRVEVCNATYGNNGWLGIAQIWISGIHITQGVVKLNDTYFNTEKYNTSAWRNLVMCQEVAHTFGLDHQDETFNNYNLGSCMDYTNYPEGGVHDSIDYGPIDYGPSNEQPGPIEPTDSHTDYDQLTIIYNDHLDSTTTVGQTVQSGRGRGKMPPALADTDSDEPVQLGTAQWGKLIRSRNHGRTELYELDLGRGHKILTHVIWAEPEEEKPGQRRGRR
jgi:hypothetical protein